MNFVNSVSKGFNNIMEAMGVSAPAKTKAPEQQKQAKPEVAHTMQKGESHQAANVKQGTAQIRLPNTDQEQIDAWIAAKTGAKIDLGSNESGRGQVMALQDHITSTYGTASAETRNAFAFLRGVEDAEGSGAIEHMAERLKDEGITQDQLDMLLNGDFEASAYVAAVETGQPVG